VDFKTDHELISVKEPSEEYQHLGQVLPNIASRKGTKDE
jgi:hypothetical protein